MNRITTLLFLGMLFPVFTFAQHFPNHQNGGKALPAQHGKSHFGPPAPAAAGQAATLAPAAGSAFVPVCVFDEMNSELSLQNPALQQEIQHYLEEVVPALSAGSSAEKSTVAPLLTISVVVHVIHNGEPVGQGQNISDAQIQAQLAILNEDYASVNPQFYDTPSQWASLNGVPNVEFCLASYDPSGNPTNGITRHNLQVTGSSWNNNNINSFIKPQTNWDPLRYFNIYVLPIPGTTAAGGVVGFANYPTPGQIGAPNDGVVIDYRWFGAPGFGVSGWRPLTHETGHYLGLPHPFNGNSCSNDDGIADTPNIDGSTLSKVTLDCDDEYPAGPASCGNEHLYVNFMDYVDENCYTSFTQGQVNVIRGVLEGTSQGFGYGSRIGLVQNAPAQCNIPAHDAGITRLVSPDPVNCTATPLVPEVTLRNFGSAELISVYVNYQVDNNPPVSTLWQGSLFPGDSEDVELPAFTPPSGTYTLSIFTDLPNGITDERPSNDQLDEAILSYVAAPPPMTEDFEGETTFPTGTGVFQFNVGNDDFAWEISNAASGFGTGGTSVVFDNFAGTASNNPFGTLDALITRHFDLTNATGAQLKFDVAYAPFDNFLSDSLMVLIATDCSQNFNQLQYFKGGMQLATAPATTQAFIPGPTQWRTETVDLSAYDGNSDVTIALVNVSGWGNRLFLDNIRVGMDCAAITYEWDLMPNSCDNPPGTCDGSATISVSNHNGGLSYQWAGWPSSHNLPTIYQLCPQQVSVTVTDGFGCVVNASASLPQAPQPELSASSTQVTTFGGSNGSATVEADGEPPFHFTWSNGFVETGNQSGTSTISGLPVGTYGVTVTDGSGCSGTASVAVTSVCAAFSVNINAGNVSCNGGANGSAFAAPQNGSGPYGVLWSNGATTQGIGNLAAGAYSVTVTDANGCPATNSTTILQPTAIVLTLGSTGETSLNAQDGTASVSASGGSPGYTFLWSNGETTSNISGLAPGTYTVTVMDVAGCTSSGSVTVNPVSCGGFQPSISAANVSCFGENDGSASVAVVGGTSPVSFAWSTGAASPSVSNLAPGQVSVSVVDGLGCNAQLSATISQPALLTANAASTNETAQGANDGTATVTAAGGTIAGGYQYFWSNGQTTASVSNLPPGNYSVTVTDANGCEATASVTVQAFLCSISLDLDATPASCPTVADGSAAVSTVFGGSGPFEYLWSNGSTNFMIQDVLAGTYFVTVTDANNCEISGSVTVTAEDDTPPTVLTQDVTIALDANGQAFLNPADVDNGSFDNCSLVNLEVSPNSFTCDDLGSQLVGLEVTDASNNSILGFAMVTVVDEMPPSITCPANLTINSCEAVDYEIPTATDNCGTATLELIAGFDSGEIFPTGTTPVTWRATDTGGNSSECTFEVTLESDLSLDYEVTQPSCAGLADGSVALQITGGSMPYTIVWPNGGDPDNLPAGSYGLTITDASGCMLTETIEVGEPPALVFELTGVTDANGGQPGSVEFEITGGNGPYTIAWYSEGGALISSFNPTAVQAGTYYAVVTDANDCEIQSELITVDQVNAVSESLLAAAVQVFPNPASGSLSLRFDLAQPQNVSVRIFDVNGREALALPSAIFSKRTEVLDLHIFAPGVYWLKILIGEQVVLKKVVVI